MLFILFLTDCFDMINSSLTSFLCVLEQCQNNSKNTTLKSKSLGNYKEQKQNTNIKKKVLYQSLESQ